MGFNKRKLEDQRRHAAEKEAAARRALDPQMATIDAQTEFSPDEEMQMRAGNSAAKCPLWATRRFEHGGACIHPMLGKPMRATVGGGKAVIPSNVKVAACGASLDVPLSHKDGSWSFDHFDTITVLMPDAPRPDEIVVVLAVADGGRPYPRCGNAPR